MIMDPTVFLAALVAFGLVMTGMAIGVIVSDRRIAGSCGGLANMQDDFGEPMCECGAKPGESCGRDDDDFDDGLSDEFGNPQPVKPKKSKPIDIKKRKRKGKEKN